MLLGYSLRMHKWGCHLTSIGLLLSLLPVLVACKHDTSSSSHNEPALQSKTTTVPETGHPAASGEPIKISNLHLDIKEKDLANSADFAYFEPGHFGEKTQYMGRLADEYGGAYAVHCRNSLPFSIEVKYSNGGIKRELAMKVMERLLPKNSGDIVEHDDEDLEKRDAKQAAEFFYYKRGPRAELLYAEDSIENVMQVNVWTKDG